MRPWLRRAAALLLAAAFSPAMAAAQGEAPPLAKLMRVEAQDAAQQRIFFGRVKSRQTIDFAFQVGGQILELPVDEGQPIAAGGLIARLDLEPFELGLARSRAQLEQAEGDFARLSRLSGSTVSQVTIDDAETAAQLARIAVQEAERSLRLATLTASFDGIVARRYLPNFSTVAAGTPVVRIHDMSDLRVEFEVPELLFQQAGADPDIVLEAEFPASPQRYPLEFREITAETTQVGQAFRVTYGMTPPAGLFLLPGSSVTVHARQLGLEAPILIPSAALLIAPSGETSVLVFAPAGAESGTVTRRAVEVEPGPMGAIRVASGLEPGEEIVAAGATLLTDGAEVRRFTGFSR